MLLPRTLSAQPPSDRRSWALDALAAGPTPTTADVSRNSLSLGLSQFADAFAGTVGGLWSLGPVEFRGRLSSQILTSYTEEGAALRPQYEMRQHWATLEVASHFVSSRGESGRMGLEFLRAMPAGENYLKVSLQTALLRRNDRPWRFVLGTSYFFPLQKAVGDTLSVRLAVDRITETGWTFGGSMAVTYRMGPIAVPGVYEIAMISLGPTLRYGNFTAGANFRALLDKRIVANEPEKNVSGLRPPDVYLYWDLR